MIGHVARQCRVNSLGGHCRAPTTHTSMFIHIRGWVVEVVHMCDVPREEGPTASCLTLSRVPLCGRWVDTSFHRTSELAHRCVRPFFTLDERHARAGGYERGTKRSARLRRR